MINDNQQPEAIQQNQLAPSGDFGAMPYSLSSCPSGTMTAKLPYFRENPLPVQVDHWTALDGTLREKTVSLLQGSIKDRYLSDSELEGAEFYPENRS